MTSKEVEITFRVKPEQAAALLEFLSCVLRADIMRALDSPGEVQPFDFASERLRVALRKVVEPDVEPDEPDEEPDEEPDNDHRLKYASQSEDAPQRTSARCSVRTGSQTGFWQRLSEAF
jgi:hypothetical protein